MKTILSHRIPVFISFLACFVLFLTETQAQKQVMTLPNTFERHWYATANIALVQDYSYAIEDPYFTNFNPARSLLGIGVGYQVNEALGFEVNYRYQEFAMGLGIKDLLGISSARSKMQFVTLRVLGSQNIWKEKLSLRSAFGLSIGSFLSNNISGLGSVTSFNFENETFVQTKTERIDFSSGVFTYLEGGLYLDYKLGERLVLSIGFMRNFGFKTIAEDETSYNFDGNEGDIISWSKGEFGGAEIGVRYNFKKLHKSN